MRYKDKAHKKGMKRHCYAAVEQKLECDFMLNDEEGAKELNCVERIYSKVEL